METDVDPETLLVGDFTYQRQRVPRGADDSRPSPESAFAGIFLAPADKVVFAVVLEPCDESITRSLCEWRMASGRYAHFR